MPQPQQLRCQEVLCAQHWDQHPPRLGACTGGTGETQCSPQIHQPAQRGRGAAADPGAGGRHPRRRVRDQHDALHQTRDSEHGEGR